MTSQAEAVRETLVALKAAGLPYMIVGSVAASFYGLTRATHDLDVVISLTSEGVEGLSAALGEDFYVDEQAALEAVDRHDMFNVVQMDSGVKVDFWMLRDDEFARTQFSRRQCLDFEGVPACVASAEDTVLSKLLWYQITPSDRQLSDVRGILELRKDRLDWDYLSDWAKRLGIGELLKRIGGEQ